MFARVFLNASFPLHELHFEVYRDTALNTLEATCILTSCINMSFLIGAQLQQTHFSFLNAHCNNLLHFHPGHGKAACCKHLWVNGLSMGLYIQYELCCISNVAVPKLTSLKEFPCKLKYRMLPSLLWNQPFIECWSHGAPQITSFYQQC